VLHEGVDLGARVEHAFDELFGRGVGYAFLAESDAPSVPNEPLAQALADDVARREILVGPSDDGGIVVLGLPQADPALMREIPWGTPQVLATLRERCRDRSTTLRELPAWYDVDEPNDVLRLMEELRKHPERAPRTAQFLVTTS
jgi:uncharacterized protein